MTLMRPLVRVLLALALFASTQGVLLIQGAFSVRQEWIAEHLCMNRNHPERECDGKCYLMKKMEEHSHHEESEHEATIAAPTVIALLTPSATVPPDRWQEASAPTPSDGLGFAWQPPDGVFHPPPSAAA